ncbi:uncharacterized protein M6B38_345790 [Iris pallida]|uniref:Uncharacterized protein n=1 Tax=Iris pallida TaxID=29817 RepID=A0AAX6GUZ5_IRIPA|nr:uncharacterized protein M6B38_345790 [Iris pallida]
MLRNKEHDNIPRKVLVEISVLLINCAVTQRQFHNMTHFSLLNLLIVMTKPRPITLSAVQGR